MSIDPVKIEQRLTPDRLSSYMDVTGGSLPQALDLYKWNITFPNLGGHPGERREMVERAIERLWFLRNRIGHHEPIHTRKIEGDITSMTSLLEWICRDTSAWATTQRRVQEILLQRPNLK